MYVLKYTATVAVTGINASAGDVVFLPAERCIFATIESTVDNAYVIDDNVLDFYPGDAAAVNLNVSTNVVELGYLGKSGRFVGTTRTRTL